MIFVWLVIKYLGANYTCTFLLLLGNMILLAKVLLHILVVVFRMNYEKDENTARHTKPAKPLQRSPMQIAKDS